MKLRKAIKKIIALGAGASMVGATMLSAMAAADLSTYPSPFVKDGAFNALIVIGEAAQPADVIGAIDIATNLQYSAKTVKKVSTGTASTTSAIGDAKKIEKSTNKLEMNESLSGIQDSVTSADLTALKDGKISNEYGDFTYTQTIYLPDGASRMIYTQDPNDATDKKPAKVFFYIPTGKSAYRYKISFSPALKSDHSTATGVGLEDIRNKKIKLLGKEYTILKAAHAAQNQTALTLMAGAVSDILEEGASKTYTVGANNYDVTLDFVGSADTKFTINGETSTSLAEGDSYKLKDGSEIGVVDILAQEFAGGLRKVEFDLGASKIKIEDLATQTDNWAGTVTVGSTDMSQVKADISTSTDQGVTHGSDVAITTIHLNYTSGSDLYVTSDVNDGSVKKEAETEEGQKGVFFADAFDYKFKGLQVGKAEDIKLIPSGSNNYQIKFTNKAGQAYSQDIVGRNAANDFRLGRYTGSTMYNLVTAENATVQDNEYVVVNKNQYSHILQFKGVLPGSSTSDDTGTLKFQDMGGNKDTYEVTYTNLFGTLTLDGNSYRVNVSVDTTSGVINGMDFDGGVSITGDPTISNRTINPELWTQLGANITFPVVSSVSGGGTGSNVSQIIVTTEALEGGSDKEKINTTFAEGGDSSSIDLANTAIVTGSGGYGTTAMQQTEDSGYKYAWYTRYGAYVEVDRKGSGNTQNDFWVKYPDEQAFGAFFVEAAPATYSTSTGEGEVETTTVTKIDVGSAVFDTDPAIAGKETDNNLIVVGGPCVNKAAAILMGATFGEYPACTSTTPENAAIIKLVEQTTGKVALIVSGWGATDTQRAARVIAKYDEYQKAGTLKGTEAQVSGTTMTDITVGAVTVKAAATTTTTETTTTSEATA